MTIIEAVKNILADNKVMSSKEIYDKIVEKNLYEFPAKNPQSVVRGENRKCLSRTFE